MKFPKTEEEWAAYRAHNDRATVRAMATLQPGDTVIAHGCGGTRRRITFQRWDGVWACGVTVDDVAATNIYRLNGHPISFCDEGEAADPQPGTRYVTLSDEDMAEGLARVASLREERKRWQELLMSGEY